MIFYLLIFLTPFSLFLSFLPATLPKGMDGFWTTAAWTLLPQGPATLPLPILLGQGALHLFPFGSPAFRLNLMGALLAALTVPLAFHALTLAKPRSAPGPTFFELEENRKWSTLVLAVLALWFFSPGVFRLGTSGLLAATNLFFPVFALERFLSWSRSPPRFGQRWISGFWAAFASGLALTLDLRWALLLPGLLALHHSFRTRAPSPNQPAESLFKRILIRLTRMTLAGIGVGSAFVFPWILLTACQVATVDQLIDALPTLMTTGIFSVDDVPNKFILIREALQTSFEMLTWGGPPIALWGCYCSLRSNRKQGSGLLYLWLFGAILIPLVPGRDPSIFPVVAGLFLALFFAGGLKSILSRSVRGPAAAFFLLPIALFNWIPFGFPRAPMVESQTADMFRSLPKDSVLAWTRWETAGAVLYAQNVLGKRRDINLLPSLDPNAPIPKPGRPFYVETPKLLSGSGKNATPVGFVFHPTPLDRLPSAFDEVSHGTLPVLLAETPPSAPSLSKTYEQLGQAFRDLNRPDQAEEAFLTAIAIDPSNGSASRSLGQLFQDYGNVQRAPAAFARASRFLPRSESLLSQWANAEFLNGNLIKSIALLREAVELNKGNEKLRSQLADLYDRTGQTKSAIVQWRILSVQQPNEKTYYWRLTQSLVAAQEWDRAFHNIIGYLNFDLTEEEREAAISLKTSLRKDPNQKGNPQEGQSKS